MEQPSRVGREEWLEIPIDEESISYRVYNTYSRLRPFSRCTVAELESYSITSPVPPDGDQIGGKYWIPII